MSVFFQCNGEHNGLILSFLSSFIMLGDLCIEWAESACSVSHVLALKGTCFEWPFSEKIYLRKWEHAHREGGYLNRFGTSVYLWLHILHKNFRRWNLWTLSFACNILPFSFLLVICFCVFIFILMWYTIWWSISYVIHFVIYYCIWWHTVGTWV